MNRRAWGSARDMVAAYAKAHPDARSCDIARSLDLLPEYVSVALRRLKIAGPTRQRTKNLHGAAPELLSIVRRFVALDGGAWNVDRHAAEKAELIADAKAAIAKAGAQ